MNMYIYAIRDRMMDYLMNPFVAPESKAVMASLSTLISNKENTDAIAQAPHHFELLQLGYVTEDGTLVPERTLVCDLASLVRPHLRDNAPESNRAIQN